MATTESTTTERKGKRQPYGLRKSIEAVKEGVPVEDYAAALTELRGNRGRCPIHGGDNRQSFCVYPDEGRWYCFRCNEGGDVIDLCRAVEGGEPWEAMVTLAIDYGVDLPERSDRWRSRQDEKCRVRGVAQRHIAGVYQRRLTRLYAPLVLLGGETPEEELEKLEELASSLWPISLDLAGKRVRGED